MYCMYLQHYPCYRIDFLGCLEIYGAIEIHVEAERMSAPRAIVHKYQCGLPVQGFAAVLFEPEHHGDSVIRLAGLYVTRQDCLLTLHPLYRLHGY